MENNFERLKAHILPLSRARVFEVARLEWNFRIEISEEIETIAPAAKSIGEHCFIRNDLTDHTTLRNRGGAGPYMRWRSQKARLVAAGTRLRFSISDTIPIAEGGTESKPWQRLKE